MSKVPSFKESLKAIQLMAVSHDDISNYRPPQAKKGLPFTPRLKKKK